MKSLVIALACAFVAAACGHDGGDIDEVVGDSCTSDRQCEERCFIGGDFPGGFCSLSCSSDNDCPEDTFCMTASGGVCMFACPSFDCSRLGAGWECGSKSRQNGGEVNVCVGD